MKSSSFEQAIQAQFDLNASVQENVTAIRVVKSYVREDYEKEKFNKAASLIYKLYVKAESRLALNNPAMMTAMYGCIIAISWVGAKMIVSGSLTTGELTSLFSYVICAVIGSILILNGYGGLSVGMLVSFLTLNKNFNQPFGQVSQQLNSIIMATAGINRIYALLDEESESDDGYISLVNIEYDSAGNLIESTKRTGKWAWKHYHKADDTTTYQELNGEILFENVDFGYSDKKLVLHDINLFAKKGQKIAFVGSTGAGKTTITNLINRFYDIQDGKIRYDNINIRKIKKAYLRKSLGVVLQDTHLFTGTIIDNIRYGRLDATDEECVQAAKLANADGFIRMLPDGYQTVISGDGGSLSQGQRQLLAIARAAVANPPVLVLDEATSSIDTHTEELVQNGMDKLMAGRTTFVIAHRLSTIRNADCIMVLENGKIIERGNHEQLIEEKGRYYQLYTGHSISE
mgnify:CR=1 FL=1